MVARVTGSAPTDVQRAIDRRSTGRSGAPAILVAEDDRRMRGFLRTVLSDHGFRVHAAETEEQGIALASTHNPDFVVLDLGRPDIDGVRITSRLRTWTTVPIMILSAYGAEGQKVAAFRAGANDFMTKPFFTSELLERVGVWLRHTRRPSADAKDAVLKLGDYHVDFDSRRVFVAGHEVSLTPTEYKLFGLLMRNAGKALTYEEILLAVWGPAYAKETPYVHIYMRHLRQKLESDPARPRFLLTEPRVGYRLRVA
jgi:two-component system KDP operon response regulator KdpE